MIVEANEVEKMLPVVGTFLGVQPSGNVAYQCNICLEKQEIPITFSFEKKIQYVRAFFNNHVCL